MKPGDLLWAMPGAPVYVVDRLDPMSFQRIFPGMNAGEPVMMLVMGQTTAYLSKVLMSKGIVYIEGRMLSKKKT